MSDWSKAFCGVEETSHGYVGWGGSEAAAPLTDAQLAVLHAANQQELFDDSCTDELDGAFQHHFWEWDMDDVARGMEWYLQSGANGLWFIRQRREGDFLAKFRVLAEPLITDARNGKWWPGSFVSLVRGTKPKGRDADERRRMHDDLVESSAKTELDRLTQEWVEDFIDDYFEGYFD